MFHQICSPLYGSKKDLIIVRLNWIVFPVAFFQDFRQDLVLSRKRQNPTNNKKDNRSHYV